jgi:class 3 adenylate cyclase
VPSLLVKEGPLAGERLEIESRLVLGRGDADVVIDDPEISRRHALLRKGDGFVEIDDLDSLNGTWVNGHRIEATTRLQPGDSFRLGKTVIEVEASAPLLAPEAASIHWKIEPGTSFAPPAPPEPAPEPPAVAPAPPPPVPAEPPPAAVPIEAGRCPECNAEVPSQARFCAYCGVALRREETADSAPPPAPAARAGAEIDAGKGDELRPVTALFADVVGSTALGERLQPHETKALIGECVNRMTRAVEQFGGTVQAYMGDGIAAFFGLPAAHEDDPERAAHAALRIIDVIKEYARDIADAWGVTDFNVRVGINTGQAAVGTVGAAQQQQVALGDTTNVAARLQSAAAPGTIAVGEHTTRRLAHRFVLESLGEVPVKGRAQPVAVWRLVGLQEGTRAPALTPLVGREDEVARLRSAVEELCEGRGQLLLLVGEVGIGKTRLLGELRTIAGDRALWLEGHCRSYGGELLYWPFVDILRRWLDVEPGEAEVSVRTKLRAKLAALPALDADEILPRLGRLLGVRVEAQGETRFLKMSEEELGGEIRVAYSAWVEALSRQQPLVLAIDDLHWADPPTRELAEALLELTDRAPVLIALAFRADLPSEGSRFRLYALEHWAHRAVELPLRPLSAEAAEELLGMLMPEGLDPRAGAELVKRAEGNPLYLEELLRSLIEGGGLERQRRTWALTVSPAALVPPALEGLLMSRIDNLPEGSRRLAQIAAVVGRTFPARVLERVYGTEEFDKDLSVLLRAHFVRELRRYPELVYTFKHGLLQEAALSTLTPTRRKELYGKVAAVFEELYARSEDEHLEVLASYYARSTNESKALEYLEKAGARAASLNANTQAVELWNRARKVAAKLEDSAAESRLHEHLNRLS